jgi:hypothetical protein
VQPGLGRVWGLSAGVVVYPSVYDLADSTSHVLWSAMWEVRQSQVVGEMLEPGKPEENRQEGSRDWASPVLADGQQILGVWDWICGRSSVESSVVLPVAVEVVCRSPESL